MRAARMRLLLQQGPFLVGTGLRLANVHWHQTGLRGTHSRQANTGREFYGWNQAVADTDPRRTLDGVRGFYQLSDSRARAVAVASLPVVPSPR
jgi:hypothetical protein